MTVHNVGLVLDNSIDKFREGEKFHFTWRAGVEQVDLFAQLTGDINPLHLDEDYALSAGFDGRVVHGFLVAAQISGFIGTVLPGKRCLLLEHRMSYHRPLYVGSSVVFDVMVRDLCPALQTMRLQIRVMAASQLVAKGEVLCQIRS